MGNIGNTTLPARRAEGVIQFSVFTANRLGRLHDLVSRLHTHNVHVLGLTVVDDPDKARGLLTGAGFACTEGEVLVVELEASRLNELVTALLEAELNVNYLYPLLPHPGGKSMLGLSMEDNDMAEQVLKRHQFRVLRQTDLSR